MKVESGLPGLRAASRLDQWWKPKAANIFAVLYWSILLTGGPFTRVALLLIPSVVTILGIGCFGHFINDLYDIATDRAAGKPNAMSDLSIGRRTLYIGGSLAIALLPWIFLPFDRISIGLLVVEFAALLVYAAPPFRGKEKMFWSIPLDAAYAFALPALLAAHTFFLAYASYLATQVSYLSTQGPILAANPAAPSSATPAAPLLIAALCCWQLALGARQYLNHLATDRRNDTLAGISTLATKKGNAFIHRFITSVILPVEVLALAIGLWSIGESHLLPALAVPAVWILFYALPHALSTDGYSFLLNRFSGMNLDRFYQQVFPLIPLGFLVTVDGRYVLLIAAHLLLLRPSLYRSGAQAILGLGWFLVFPFFSSVKHALSWLFRRPKGIGQAPAIVVANINKEKYTETFINEMLPRLKYRVHNWYGGALPDQYRQPDGNQRSFLPEWKFLQQLLDLLENIGAHPHRFFLKQKHAHYLQYHQIKLLLAEFGPVGAALSPLTSEMGLPLIVWFHGYDVYNRQQLAQYSTVYPQLFREATRIIAVSAEMADRLIELGAPPDKLVHLPAFVNLDLFPYTDRGGFPPAFLAVGRFSETKSPHLTLLAFNKVLQQIPAATLTMVGKGGGGELFEACVILTRALGIEKSVFFRGALSHEDTAREMQKARVFVQHSLTTPEHQDKEGKPVAIMEAMCAGLPVIATNHSGIRELIRHGETGILVEEYDLDAMAAAMIRLVKDHALVSSLGLQASAFIQQEPLIKQHIHLLEALIDECLEEGAAPRDL